MPERSMRFVVLCHMYRLKIERVYKESRLQQGTYHFSNVLWGSESDKPNRMGLTMTIYLRGNQL